MKLKFTDIILREDDSVSLMRLLTIASFTTYTILYICSFIWEKPMPFFETYTTFNASIIFASIGSKVADAKFLGMDMKMKQEKLVDIPTNESVEDTTEKPEKNRHNFNHNSRQDN